MINYLKLGETQYPASFGNAAFMGYEDLTGSSVFADFGPSLPLNTKGEFDFTKIKIGFFARVAFCALVSGGNIARQPFALSLDEVANYITLDTLPDIINRVAAAMPKADTESDTAEKQGEATGPRP